MQHLGIFLFDGVEVLDFAGPFEFFQSPPSFPSFKI